MKSPWAIPDDPRMTEGGNHTPDSEWATEDEIQERDKCELDCEWEKWWDEVYQETDPS
jgi:hypothetical protein